MFWCLQVFGSRLGFGAGSTAETFTALAADTRGLPSAPLLKPDTAVSGSGRLAVMTTRGMRSGSGIPVFLRRGIERGLPHPRSPLKVTPGGVDQGSLSLRQLVADGHPAALRRVGTAHQGQLPVS